MTMRTAIIFCALVTLLAGAPQLLMVRPTLTLLDADVRARAADAMQSLRSEGMWLVHVSLIDMQSAGDRTCFLWEHAYRSRSQPGTPEQFAVCK